ncbi:hypothetical protein RND71_003138 [Anisodus tanguticus]|uniref:F-box associated beta-propeller type 1 domain-containing protein n=1 Tax=Anisodus tanguticus TaxID=243964 RepID=A0AAE1SVC6_9SOLA|nr:hypothetical protein RND71_003138 [Anisodus tanguticus]
MKSAKIQWLATRTHHNNPCIREIGKSYNDVKTYSLKSNSWRTLDDFQGEMVYSSSGKLMNGKLHWVTTADGGWDIMSIDLVDEIRRKVEQPCYGEGNSLFRLGVLEVICSYERTYERTDCG